MKPKIPTTPNWWELGNSPDYLDYDYQAANTYTPDQPASTPLDFFSVAPPSYTVNFLGVVNDTNDAKSAKAEGTSRGYNAWFSLIPSIGAVSMRQPSMWDNAPTEAEMDMEPDMALEAAVFDTYALEAGPYMAQLAITMGPEGVEGGYVGMAEAGDMGAAGGEFAGAGAEAGMGGPGGDGGGAGSAGGGEGGGGGGE